MTHSNLLEGSDLSCIHPKQRSRTTLEIGCLTGARRRSRLLANTFGALVGDSP